MSEFMGLICGDYDAKSGKGFQPAGASLHNIMSPHGPDAGTHEKASNAELKPAKVGEGSMAFMFESCLMVGVTEWGLRESGKVQEGYNVESWTPLKSHLKVPEGVNVISNKAEGLKRGDVIDISQSVNGKKAGTEEMSKQDLPHYS